MSTVTSKRKPVATLICQVFFESHTEEGLYRVWELAQEQESEDFVHFRTHQYANNFSELENVRQDFDGMWRANCIVQRDNVRGNWKSDLTRTMSAAEARSGLQVETRVEVLDRIVTEK